VTSGWPENHTIGDTQHGDEEESSEKGGQESRSQEKGSEEETSQKEERQAPCTTYPSAYRTIAGI